APPDAAVAESPPPPARPHVRLPAPPRSSPPPQSDTATVTEGWLAVGGEGALKAEIFVDGKSAGFAPRRIPVCLRDHQIDPALPTGERKSQRIRILPTHTPSAPARLTLP